MNKFYKANLGMKTLMACILVAPASATTISASVSSSAGVSITSSDVEAYEAFRSQLRHREKMTDETEFQRRLAVFKQRKAQVEAQNARPDKIWWATLNKFADMTNDEYQAMLGYRRVGPRRAPSMMRSSAGSSLLEMDSIADSRDWRSLNSSKFARVQGGCGSCWAVAAAGALEMHAELHLNIAQKLSFKELLDCTPNPRHCGGEGGCQGATGELALEYAANHGIARASDYEDGDSDGECRKDLKRLLKPKGFVKLPENELKPLMHAVSEKGPVVVSVDAEPWSIYSGGVFDGCGKDATVNHAVIMVGYGTDDLGGKYWLIRNSWGTDWGENGFIRIKRHDGDKANGGADGFCGTDYDPKVGVGCDNGPKTLPVCGMCGILSDSAYPKM
eukprot:gb/GFBE01079753.1/.p1 GENE.gb/GFBE01079753.1/~~gb/GFBE01079753.1/.p1  ORF type:complete len:389 (+),score=88.88 gb/GFBE01079753.1/:1-1167(+)